MGHDTSKLWQTMLVSTARQYRAVADLCGEGGGGARWYVPPQTEEEYTTYIMQLDELSYLRHKFLTHRRIF